MATIINIILAVCSFLAIYLIKLTHFDKIPSSGDAVMGYAWGTIYGFVLFFGLTLASAILMSVNGGFSWIASSGMSRFFLIFIGLFAVSAAACISSLMKNEGSYPMSMRYLMGIISFVLPILILFSLFAINSHLDSGELIGSLAQWCYKGSIILSLVTLGVILISLLIDNLKNQERVANQNQLDYDANNARMIEQIQATDVNKDMINLFVYADENKASAVKDSAVAKIKSHIDWQKEMINILYGPSGFQAFDFLASNPVDNPELFPHAVNSSLYTLSTYIKDQINEAYQEHHLYADQFRWEIERAIKTVNQFKGMGTDFRPAMFKLKEALETKGEVKHQPFRCKSLVEAWLK